jgi:hypothetical protein
LSEIIKHLVLEHLVERLVLRKEDVVYLTGIQKIFQRIISVRHILSISFLVKVRFPPNACDPSVQGGKIGERKELGLSWLRIVVHTSEKWCWHYWLFLGGVLWLKYPCSVNCQAYVMREGQVSIGIHALVQGFN